MIAEDIITDVTENPGISISGSIMDRDIGISYNGSSLTKKSYISNITEDNMFSRNRIAGAASSIITERFPFSSAMVIGCGGIGSWVARLLGNVEKIQHLFLIDPDNVEVSNLARTPFKIFNVDNKKVESLSQEITETNIFCNVYAIPSLFDEVSMNHIRENILKYIIHGYNGEMLIIDCRDDDYQDYDILEILNAESSVSHTNFTILRAAYDDTSVTIDLNPVGRSVWGGRGYSVQPSHILPSFMSALLILSVAFNYNNIKQKYPYMFKYPMTFNCLDILPLLFFSARTITTASLGDKLFEQVVQRWNSGDFDTSSEPVKTNEG